MRRRLINESILGARNAHNVIFFNKLAQVRQLACRPTDGAFRRLTALHFKNTVPGAFTRREFGARFVKTVQVFLKISLAGSFEIGQ